MARPRFYGEWIWIRFFDSETFFKVKVLSSWKQYNVRFLRILFEDGHVTSIQHDSILEYTRNKKAKILRIKPKLRIVK